MLKIKINKDRDVAGHGGEVLKAGKTYSQPEKDAKYLVAAGRAEFVQEKKSPAKKKRVRKAKTQGDASPEQTKKAD